MNERAAFVAAIRAEPAEDTPRLAFADWLDEHGEPARAEFIRVQCELARMNLRQVLRPMGLAFEEDWDRSAPGRRERSPSPRRARVRLHEGTVIIRGEVVDVHFSYGLSTVDILGCVVEEISPLEEPDLIVFEATLLIGPDGYEQRGRRNELLTRERELFLAHALEWLVGFPSTGESPALHPGCLVRCGIGPADRQMEYVFRRGFPVPDFFTIPLGG